MELHAKWAPNVVTTLGRFAGRTVGVIANNPLRLGGCLDAASAEKAARFVRMCDALGVPLVVLVDVPGYLPGLGQEWDGVVRRGAKLLHAFAEAVVPRVTLVTRKAYGGAYIAMNSRSLGATAVFAWPDAEVAVMGASAAVNVLHRKKLAAAPHEEREALRAQLVERADDRWPAGCSGRWRSASSTTCIAAGRDPAPHRGGAGRRTGRPRRARQHPALNGRPSRPRRASQGPNRRRQRRQVDTDRRRQVSSCRARPPSGRPRLAHRQTSSRRQRSAATRTSSRAPQSTTAVTSTSMRRSGAASAATPIRVVGPGWAMPNSAATRPKPANSGSIFSGDQSTT